MDILAFMEKSYILINSNLEYYKKHYDHIYYVSVKEDETSFIRKLFNNAPDNIPAKDMMLNYSVTTMYAATAVLLEILRRKNISYTTEHIESLCAGFSRLGEVDYSLNNKSYDELYELVFGLLTDGIDLESRKKSGSERTPDGIIKYMLDLAGYSGNSIKNKRIIDPACGTGTFVAQMVERFIQSYDEEISLSEIKKKLICDRCIIAYDTKPSNVYITKLVIALKLIENDILTDINDIVEIICNMPVVCNDFLKVTETADYIVGNPPYIRLQNLPVDYRDYIKENFQSGTGRFDIYTCFLEKGDKSLNPNGHLCLITSNKFLTTNYGVGIRKYLSDSSHVRKIIDLFDTKFFGAAVLPAITVCENNVSAEMKKIEYIGIKSSAVSGSIKCKTPSDLFNYVENMMNTGKEHVLYGDSELQSFEISKSLVDLPIDGKTWNFISETESDIKAKMEQNRRCFLSDLFDICVGIKTTADTVFVKPMTQKFIDSERFENNVIYPLIQSFNVEKWTISWGKSAKDRYILYPHKEVNGSMTAIPLEEMPVAAAYLIKNGELLKKRKYLSESKTREWYECWVPQKLSKFQQPKIITRDIVSHNSFALDTEGRLCQGNTFFMTRKPSLFSSEYSSLNEEDYLMFMLGVLNSKVMEYYQKMISGCLYSQKYRYTTSNLNRWPIPFIGIDQAKNIAALVHELLQDSDKQQVIESEIDNIMYKCFGLNACDIDNIRQFVETK